MSDNPLLYQKNRTSPFSRKARECLPSPERELFIKECARKGESIIGLRQKNRYIDEYLVFNKRLYGFYAPQKLTSENFSAFDKAITKDSSLKKSTKKIKIVIVKRWLKWLYSNGHVSHEII